MKGRAAKARARSVEGWARGDLNPHELMLTGT